MPKISIEQARSFLESSTKKPGKIGVIGDLALDRFVFGDVERISPEAPVPVLKCDRVEERLGCAANVVANIAEFLEPWDITMRLASVVGGDKTATKLEERIAELSPKIEMFLEKDSSRVTPLKTRYIAGSQHQLLRVDSETSTQISGSALQKLELRLDAFLEGLDVLIVQDYAKGLLNNDFGARVIQKCRAKRIFCLVDPNLKSPVSVYRGASLITPNTNEAEALLGYSLEGASNNFLMEKALKDLKDKLQLANVMITRGKFGLSLLCGEASELHHLPTHAREVFDVTGAGDTMVSVLAVCLSGGASLPEAAYLANIASGIVVAKVGTATASPSEMSRALARL